MSEQRVTVTGRPAVTNIPPNSAGAEGAPAWVTGLILMFVAVGLLAAALVYWFA